MKTRKEIELALCFAEQQHAAEESIMRATRASPYDSSEYCRARVASALWAGRIDAYRFVLSKDGPV